MAAPRLSIVIPTYNRAELLSQTLGTVLAQGHLLRETEIIISNDCSNDSTASVLEAFKNNNPNYSIQIFNHEKNLGGPGNWEFLLSKAKGEFIYLLSDDDWISAEFLKNYFEILDSYSELDIVYSGFEYRDANMNLLEVSLLSSVPGLASGSERLKNQLRANHMVMSSVYRTQTLREAGGWNPRYGMHIDGGAFSMTALRSRQTYFIDKPLFYFRIGAETWSTFKVEKQKINFRCYRLIIDDLIGDAKKLKPEMIPFLKSCYGIHAQAVINMLDIKAAHQNISRKDLRRLLIDLVRTSPETLERTSFYKMYLVSVFGYGWLNAIRKLLNKPEVKNSSVFERTGS